MNHRCLASASAVAVVSAIILWTPASIAGQALSDAKASAAVKAAPSAKPWTPSRTPDGHPDLQGFWTNNTVTPMERLKDLGAKEFYTEQEMAENAKQEEARAKVAVLGRGTEPGTAEDVHYDFSQFGLDRGQSKVAWNRRTSLIVGPDGTVPKLLPEAQKRAADRAAANRGHQFDAAGRLRSRRGRPILRPRAALEAAPGGLQPRRQQPLAAAQIQYAPATRQQAQLEDCAIHGICGQFPACEVVGKPSGLAIWLACRVEQGCGHGTGGDGGLGHRCGRRLHLGSHANGR